MEVCALASGSSGNCFYVGNENVAVLVDVGISAKQVLLRMEERGLDLGKVKGIFVTHEHIDHVRGVDVLARKLGVPIYVTKHTADACTLCSDEILIKIIKNTTKVKVGELQIESFSKSHHAADPVSYTIIGKRRVSVITDLGHACKEVQKHVSLADFLCLESNYDDEMLHGGGYPIYLKKLIASDIGHLSNRQAGLCVLEHAHANLQKVILSHISKNNNDPKIALETFSSLVKERQDLKPEISLSIQGIATEVFRI